MSRSCSWWWWLVGPLFAAACAPGPKIPPLVADAISSRMVSQKIPGVVVAVFDPHGVRIQGFGTLGLDRTEKTDGHTLFEVGSVTKLFTGLLLADMVRHGEVSLDDRADRWLRPPTATPSFQGRTFTLLDLATHRSGLPRDPVDGEAWSTLSDGAFLGFLSTVSLATAPGTRLFYSNLGVSVLGRALADRAGSDYSALLSQRILLPLGLRETFLDVPPAQAGREATGSRFGSPVPSLDLKAGRPAGGLRTTAADLVRFLRQNLGQVESPLAESMELSRQVQPGRAPLALGWMEQDSLKGPLYYHAGATPGFRAWVELRPSDGRGEVILTNSTADLQDLAYPLLDPEGYASGDWTTTVALGEPALQRYAGTYTFRGTPVVVDTRPNGLSLQLNSGIGTVMEFTAQTGSCFIDAERHARLSFLCAGDGTATTFTLETDGCRFADNPRVGRAPDGVLLPCGAP